MIQTPQLFIFKASLVAELIKNLPAVQVSGSVPGLGRSPGEGNGNPLQYPWPGKSHGQHSLVGCSLWGRKDSGMTERLTLAYLHSLF